MPSMIVCRCACGSAKRATTGCSAFATGCCGVPSYAAAISRRHHASFARATSGSPTPSTTSSTSRQKA